VQLNHINAIQEASPTTPRSEAKDLLFSLLPATLNPKDNHAVTEALERLNIESTLSEIQEAEITRRIASLMRSPDRKAALSPASIPASKCVSVTFLRPPTTERASLRHPLSRRRTLRRDLQNLHTSPPYLERPPSLHHLILYTGTRRRNYLTLSCLLHPLYPVPPNCLSTGTFSVGQIDRFLPKFLPHSLPKPPSFLTRVWEDPP
jgi:hypothetical protein